MKQAQNNKSNSQESASAPFHTGKGGKALPAVPVLQQKTEAAQENSGDTDLHGADRSNQVQSSADDTHQIGPFQLKNDTGLPDMLKSGIENLSGFSMDDVKVHYNSDKPAQLQAFAFAQGTDIHVGEGQEKHIPHEAWHVVQQKQGRVKPTVQMLNEGLEKGGDKAAGGQTQLPPQAAKNVQLTDDAPIQRKVQAVQVVWDVTHAVYEVGGSLFGADDFTENEGPELTAGTKLLIDDGSTFISRRGSNQENRDKRATEKLTRPSVHWYQVMQLPNGLDVSGRNLYIRSGTFREDNTKVPGQLSKEDKYWLEKFAGEAREEGQAVSDGWRDRTEIGNTTIRHMFSLKSLGEKIVQNAGIFRVFSDSSIGSAAATDLIAKYVATLSVSPRYIGIIVNGLTNNWSSLSGLAKYLAIPYDTLVATYEQLDSVEKRRGMFQALTQPEQNIEKYTTLIMGRLTQEMSHEGGIVEELKAMLLGHPTSSISVKLLVWGIAGDFFKEYLKFVNYDDKLVRRHLFNAWLAGKGFTLGALVTALKFQIEAVDLSEVESNWGEYFTDAVFDVYEEL